MKRDINEIRCDNIRPRLSEYIDHALTVDEMDAFAKHLEDCPHCAAEADLLMATAAAAAEAAMVPPPSLYPSVMKSVRRRHFMKMLVRSGGTVAAAVAIVVTLFCTKPYFKTYENAPNLSNDVQKSGFHLPQYTSPSLATHQKDSTNISESTQAEDRDIASETPTPDDLLEILDILKDDFELVYILVRFDEFEGLRAELTAESVLYMDTDNIVFEYQAQIDLPSNVVERGYGERPIVVVATCFN
ncbi:MAG: zf-HC2 domain-containing protein [Clostridiales bacterium]|nr:zf-HC2 domain-containing protein [Clostridiales bacterium]